MCVVKWFARDQVCVCVCIYVWEILEVGKFAQSFDLKVRPYIYGEQI